VTDQHTEAVVAQGLQGCGQPLATVYDLAVLDLDGVVYVGPDAVPGAAAAIARAGAAGMRCCFLTNNASRPPEVVAEHLRSLSVPAEVSDVLTSAQVGAALLAATLAPGSRVLVVGGLGLQAALTEVGLVPVSGMDAEPVAVVQGFSPELSWRLLAEATRAVRAGLFWVATNLDLTVPTPHGPAPGNGSLVQVVATAAGRGPDAVAGKPQPEPFLDAVRRYGARAPLAVGDRLDTDVQGAVAAGMPALAVLTGVCGVTDLVHAAADRRPTYLGADLSALLDSHPATAVSAHSATCRAARVVIIPDGDGAAVSVRADGQDPLDLLRAACAAAWAWTDQGGAAPSTTGLLQALARFETTTAWAR